MPIRCNWQRSAVVAFGRYDCGRQRPVEDRNRATDVTIPGGGYGHRDPEPDLEVYVVGGKSGEAPHPQTWSRVVKQRGGQRVFYTRYDPKDVDTNPTVRRMVIDAIFWAAGRELEE